MANKSYRVPNYNFEVSSYISMEINPMNLDRMLLRLFGLINSRVYNPRLLPPKYASDGYNIDIMTKMFAELEESGKVIGAASNRKGVESWLRSSLLNQMRSKVNAPETIVSLRPNHLLSYKLQNKKSKYNRGLDDRNLSNMVYDLLSSDQHGTIYSELRDYLMQGWDRNRNQLDVNNSELDVDTVCILYLQSLIQESPTNNIRATKEPILKHRAQEYCDDVRRLMSYKTVIPKKVFIDYFRILTGFHLSLYVTRLAYLLPLMVKEGRTDVDEEAAGNPVSQWTMIVDLSDNLKSEIAPYAITDFKRILGNEQEGFIKAVFAIMTAKNLTVGNSTLATALEELAQTEDVERRADFRSQCRTNLTNFKRSLPDNDLNGNDAAFNKHDFEQRLKFFDKKDYLGQWLNILCGSSTANRVRKYYPQLVESLMMKNEDSHLIAAGRNSSRQPRRGAMGIKLLETLLLVNTLKQDEHNKYHTKYLTIPELIDTLQNRYGLSIDGSNLPSQESEDLQRPSAFSSNVEALKDKLRQMGVYLDMSDSSTMQTIMPRYIVK